MIKGESNWYEGVAFQRSAFGRSTAGNDVVAKILKDQQDSLSKKISLEFIA